MVSVCTSLGQWHSHVDSTTDNRTVLMLRKEATERKWICDGEEATIRVAITQASEPHEQGVKYCAKRRN